MANLQEPVFLPGETNDEAIALSRDGRFALSGANDGVVRLWSVISRQCLQTLQGHTDPVMAVGFSRDGRYGVSGSSNELLVWEFDWELDERKPADWVEAAQPLLQAFLVQQTPCVSELPRSGTCSESDLVRALTRQGKPQVADADLERFLRMLSDGGFGWLRPEGVKNKVLDTAANWSGLPPPFAEDGGPADA